MYIYYQRLIIFFVIILVLAVSYILFKENVHLWFCENDNNGASCSIIGMIHEEHKEYERAEKYLKKSCDMNYGLGCYKLAMFLKKIKNSEESRVKSLEYLQKSCSLEHLQACQLLKVNHK